MAKYVEKLDCPVPARACVSCISRCVAAIFRKPVGSKLAPAIYSAHCGLPGRPLTKRHDSWAFRVVISSTAELSIAEKRKELLISKYFKSLENYFLQLNT